MTDPRPGDPVLFDDDGSGLRPGVVAAVLHLHGEAWVTVCEEPGCVRGGECRCRELGLKALVPAGWLEPRG